MLSGCKKNNYLFVHVQPQNSLRFYFWQYFSTSPGVSHELSVVTPNFFPDCGRAKCTCSPSLYPLCVCLPLLLPLRWEAVERRHMQKDIEKQRRGGAGGFTRGGGGGKGGLLKLKPVLLWCPCLVIIYIKLTFGEFTLGSVIVFFRQFCIANRENGILSTLTNF